ncbi:cytidylyltransferase domain-containing protein [Caulobacter sp. DWR1-3-2b1]|uniref:cytidylyltransferase domain-containing protein n=1 Tax=Caulobacter sp. DWR1-3-2b1 TaxID=2804670 RepID=UPI003CF8F1AE
MILAVLQARMSSTRLPGKVLMPILREPMIVRQIERVARSRRIDKLVVATSDQPGDDVLADAVRKEGIAVHRGPLDNVLERFIGALDAHPADHVVRLTADCPLADPELIDATIDLHLSTGADYASNSPDGAAWPKGLDVEVITADGLRRAARQADSPEAREHVTWDVWNNPLQWKIAWLPATPGEDAIRWTVDRPDDYAFVATVYDHLYPTSRNFSSADIKAFVAKRPDLANYGGDRRG